MPDKERERFYLTQLRKCELDLPEGEPSEPEPPDFLLGDPPRRVGIEITTFHLPPQPGSRPHQEIQSLKDQAVEMAAQLHAAAGGPALYLTAIFGPHGNLRKRTVRPIAEALAAAVMSQPLPRSIEEPRIEVPRHLLPREIAHVHAHGSIDGVDSLWQADAGGWVAEIQPEHIQSAIDRKVEKARTARLLCDELWLVIVHDLFIGAAPAELAPQASQAMYRHAFDRVLWLEPHGPRTIRLAAPAV
jgi:hypothetical protein